MNKAIAAVLKRDDFVCFTAVLMEMGKLSKKDHDSWRSGRTPFLEAVISLNLAGLGFLLRAYATQCGSMGLKPSWTAYRTCGRGRKHPLRFSKSGAMHLEKAYATHFIRKSIKAKPAENERRIAKNAAADEQSQAVKSESAEARRRDRTATTLPDHQYPVKLSIDEQLQAEAREVDGGKEKRSDGRNKGRPTSTLSNIPLMDDDLPF
jgi:hypothetical protein